MQTVALRTTPSIGILLTHQIRITYFRLKWDLLVYAGLMIIYQMSALPSLGDTHDYLGLALFTQGALGLPGHFIFMCLTALWSFRVWADFPPRQRLALFSYPVDRILHHTIRVTAGAVVLLMTLAISWLLGALICEISSPGSSYFANEAYRGWGWIITLIGLINVYLFGTILSIVFKRPEQWFVLIVFLPWVVGMMLIGIDSLRGIGILVARLISWQDGLMSGFGFVGPGTEGLTSLPGLPHVLMWCAILVGGVIITARIRRDE